MYSRREIAAINVVCSAVVLVWAAPHFALAADDVAPWLERPAQADFEKPIDQKARPSVPKRSYAAPGPKPFPRPSPDGMRGAAIGQAGKVLAPSSRIAPTVDPAKTGPPTVVGRVFFRGAIPPATQIEVNRDIDICGQVVSQQPISIDPTTGGLRNAIIHVDAGAAVMAAEASSDGQGEVVQVVNKKCTFYPQIAAGRTGSEVEIVNNDPLMHNTNMTAGNRTIINVALVAGGTPIRKEFKKAGLHMVKCNVHKFMYGYRYVFDDVFFATTTEAGQYRISNLPPGTHTVTVWHETLGIVQKEVQVPTQGTVTLDFEFK